ncbi:Glucan endo-1,3-beta-glucosidase [Quillaja saponaria]|uniref:Glucan endo-1,3-beta-glucosidase n=1 Tax=Quillaja saponaria TaxID=32244 RepID=A0AAD7LUP6_QUISA|nr:Glucan endo-1,3-beta-glucosidase [Quillaja saponaria]
MDSRRPSILILYLYIAANSSLFTLCEARNHPKLLHGQNSANRGLLDSSNFASYSLRSPFSLPPFNSLPPLPLPANTPPYCVDPPLTTPQPHGSSSTPSPPLEPIKAPSPTYRPGVSPPKIGHGLSPPQFVPSPHKHVPSPPKGYLPPVVYPPPLVPTPPHKNPQFSVWCVAKPTVPDPIIQVAMDYACGSGADCKSIQPNGPCYQPDTLLSHASFAFNSYWQKTKVGGGTCDFGGTAMLVTVDPSFNRCKFIFNS